MMTNTLRSMALALLLQAGSTIGAGFLDQGCDSLFSVRDGILTAKCDDQVCGNKVYSYLDLNHCILNRNGNMYYGKSGNFYRSCKDCWIAGSSHLTCTCLSNDQDRYIGLVDLDLGVITNYYGYVNCFNTINTAVSHNWPCKGKNWKPWGRHVAFGNGTHGPDAGAVEPESDGTLFVPAYADAGPEGPSMHLFNDTIRFG